MIKVYEIDLKSSERAFKDEFDTLNVALSRCRRFASMKCKELMEGSDDHYHVNKNEDSYEVVNYKNGEKIYRYEVGE